MATRYRSKRVSWGASAGLLLLCLLAFLARSLAAADERVVWKPMEAVILRVDDRAAKMWNVYHAEKKQEVFLIQLGLRYLMLNGREKQVYELASEKLTKKGKELVFNESDLPAKPLETSEWIVRNVGPVRRYKVHLDAEGRDIDLQIALGPNQRPIY